MHLRLCFYLICAASLFGCQSDGNISDWKTLDLLSYGIPFSILAPDSARVETIDFGTIMKDVTIKSSDDYFVQIFASDANTTDINKLKQEQLNEVKAEKHFSKIIEESDQGFIYESVKDSTFNYYGFRYIRLQGTKEYILQNGFRGFFNENQARSMFKAVAIEPKK